MSEPLTGVIPKGTTNEAQLEELSKILHITQDASEVTDLQAVPNTNFLFGGLNIVYGVDGSGKSWQVSAGLKNSEANNFYLDTDGSNGQLFVNHCIQNNVYYVLIDSIEKLAGNKLIKKITMAIITISQTMTILKNVIVIDSLTSIADGLGINNAEDISPTLYELNKLAAKYNIALILIDHATENNDLPGKFKLEGNAGAKRRATVTVNRYVPIDKKNPSKGGTFTCERARGNSSNITTGKTHVVSSTNFNDALEFIINKIPVLKTNGITKSDFTLATKHTRNIWVRDYFDQLFDVTKKNRKTILTLKKEFI